MRILIVSTWFPSADRPDIAPFNVAHAKAITRNHDVQVVHAQLGGSGPIRQEEYAGLPVTRVPINPRRPLAVARSLSTLRRLVRGADVVHSMAFSSLGVLAPLYPVIGKRWVHTEHWSGTAFPDRIPGVWQRLSAARHLLRLPRRVSTVSSVLAEAIAKFARRDAVDVIPCVVDESFRPVPQPSWTPLKLVAVGGLVTGKRPQSAVDTVRELVATGVDTHLTWVGDGALHDEIRERITEYGLADRIDLVGAVSPEKVADHVRAANLFFLPTAFETFLAAGAEAIACGRPVVLPNTGGFTDYVTEANGVIIEQDDPKTLAQAVQQARDRFADVSADTISATGTSRFSEETIAEKFDEFYSHLEK
ncbi:glycosyltransferase family 4 protein [Haloactinomyces albus]|uniref:Glycosyltransferase involved in cell wall biosynthesis n=1 Tax=Haloactinomyces albus TaxID=1352928 RepID=A0AAE4CLZ3_9ACTN|nr:glycosyltransferase family 4 protein [Haloactinomyces albus]MDR7301856.1 glycosyltransferase involved in cell wall biosynthesis [Haloactinomyces albus]